MMITSHVLISQGIHGFIAVLIGLISLYALLCIVHIVDTSLIPSSMVCEI